MNSDEITRLSRRALLDELETTPKPGLVDLHDSGSHKDMDFDVMSRGIEAVSDYFGQMFDTAEQMCECFSMAEILSVLRKTGQTAENAMYRATGGVNTHKGAIFSFGMVSGALGILKKRNLTFTPSAVGEVVRQLASGVENELDASMQVKDESLLTAGEKFFLSCGSQGARGQAASGYSFVIGECLPLFRKLNRAREKFANLKTFAYIMSKLDDSNVYKRGGIDGVNFVKASGKDLYDNFSLQKAAKLNDEFVGRNLSPGGAADLLALTFLLDSATQQF